MESLSTYLVLTGELTPAESLLLQRVVVSQRLTRQQARKLLLSSGWNNLDDVISSLQVKELINTKRDLTPNWKGLSTWATAIEGKIIQIAGNLMNLKKKADLAQEESSVSIIPGDVSIGDIILQFSGNKTMISEKTIIKALPLVSAIEMVEWLEEFGFIKIQKGKRSRKLTITAEGSALRYLFMNKSSLNNSNYNYLEQTLLAPKSENWTSFVEKAGSDGENQPVWVSFLISLFKDLEILEMSDDGKFNLSAPLDELPFDESPVYIEEFLSGFIPVYVSNLYDVLQALPAKPATIQRVTGLGSSSVSGIVKMLSKFNLATKTRQGKSWLPSRKGKRLASLPEESFIEAFQKEVQRYPVFCITTEFIRQNGGEIGFLDLSGFFRTSGVSNFNPAKSLSILRLMAQTGFELEEADRSGVYRLIETDDDIKRD